MNTFPVPLALLAAATLWSLSACGDSAEFGVEQRFSARERPVDWGVSEQERLRLRDMGPATTGAGAAKVAAGFTAPTPEGWRELPPQPAMFKDLDYEVAGDPDASCYLTASVGGGVEGNIARWYGQLGQRLTAAVTDLPQHELMDGPARLVEIEGTFKGQPDFKLLGLIAGEGGECTTLKLTGPRALVEAERERFLELARGIRPKATTAPGGPAGAGDAPARDELSAWQAPEGWQSVPSASPMRLLTYKIGENTECSVLLLGGDGGGVRLNLDRWQGQLGLAPLTDEEFSALPEIPLLGENVRLLERRGPFSDAMTQRSFDDAVFLGVAVVNSAGAFFVKLTGPHAEAQTLRQEFIDFCASLRR